jgi:zinc transport system substrate-binding protein
MAHRRVVSLALAVAIAATLAACSDDDGGNTGIRVAAAFYPLAWVAGQVGGSVVTVEDLTPPGAEPHEIQLTANQRSSIQDATLVFYLGRGFQPEMEDAVRDIGDRAVDLLNGLSLLPSKEEGLSADPHVWLDPALMVEIVGEVSGAFSRIDPEGKAGYQNRAEILMQQLTSLDEGFSTGLASCALRTLVTTHEAFGYLARRYELTQVGLTGLTPEAEPSAAQIRRVRDLARQGTVAAIFVEATDEGRRIGRSVARDVGVPARDLSTLETDPKPKDYLGTMNDNLASLTAGLRCS